MRIHEDKYIADFYSFFCQTNFGVDDLSSEAYWFFFVIIGFKRFILQKSDSNCATP
jgi:hypothetical protein